MTTLTTVFRRSSRQSFFLTFSVFKASLLSRGYVSVCVANRGDMHSTDDDPMHLHRAVLRKQIVPAHFFETRGRCSAMCSGAQNLSVGLKKSLVFSHREYYLGDAHFCEGARPATSASSVGKHSCAPQMNCENGACSCARFAWSNKQVLSHTGSRYKKTKGISTLFSGVTFHARFPIAFSLPSSVAPCMATGLGVRDVGQYKTSSHVQEIPAAEPTVCIYLSAVSYFSGSSRRASWSRNPLCWVSFWRASILRNGSAGGRPAHGG